MSRYILEGYKWSSYVFILPLHIFQCSLEPLKILFQQVFIFCSSIPREHKLFCFLCSFTDLLSSLGVQFNNCNVPCETLNKWRLKSSLSFTFTNCFNLWAARYKNIPSLLSSHACFFKTLGSLLGQLVRFFIMVSKSLMLIIRTCWYSLPSLPSMSQSDDATGNRTRIRGGIPKIYLKETWNMVCGRRAWSWWPPLQQERALTAHSRCQEPGLPRSCRESVRVRAASAAGSSHPLRACCFIHPKGGGTHHGPALRFAFPITSVGSAGSVLSVSTLSWVCRFDLWVHHRGAFTAPPLLSTCVLP